MIPIQPLPIWKNGSVLAADMLNLYVVNDDLRSACVFHYSLHRKSPRPPSPLVPEDPATEPAYTYESLTEGNLYMSGDAYDGWNTETDINGAAYQWAAHQLGITLAVE